ncbi:MAG: ABC transporter ATP-binding protein [Magnetococcales bacterium]|nr:ABC transporter ATP-binding protein [Magnetococcales bacterium]
MLSVGQLAFEYPGQRVLEDISFTLPTGEITALVGPNGAGKTTLLRCLSALHPPFSGTITYQGEDIFDNPRNFHRHIGYLADDFGLYDELTVEQSLLLAARRHQTPMSELANRLQDTLMAVDLIPHRQHKAQELSRGLRQRLAIGQTIIHQPRLLLLDEPASGLDPEARISLAQLFIRLKQQGMTLLVSSHILAELEAYSDHMLVLRHGRLAGFETLKTTDTKPHRTLHLTLEHPCSPLLSLLHKQSGVSQIKVEGVEVSLQMQGGDKEQKELLRLLIQEEIPVLSFGQRREDIQTRYIANYADSRQQVKP